MTKNAIFTKTTSGLFRAGPAPADPTCRIPAAFLPGTTTPISQRVAPKKTPTHAFTLKSFQVCNVLFLPGIATRTNLRFEIQPKATPLLQVIRGIFRKVHTSFWLCHAPTLKYRVVCSLPARSHFPLPRGLTRCSHPGFALTPLRLLPSPGHVLSSLRT